MTVAAHSAVASFAWTGAETQFTTSIPADAASDVRVTHLSGEGIATRLVRGVHYTSSLVGGALRVLPLVAMLSAPATLQIERRTPATQTLDLVNGGDFDADAMERQLDRATLRDGEAQARLDALEAKFPATFQRSGITSPAIVPWETIGSWRNDLRQWGNVRLDGSADTAQWLEECLAISATGNRAFIPSGNIALARTVNVPNGCDFEGTGVAGDEIRTGNETWFTLPHNNIGFLGVDMTFACRMKGFGIHRQLQPPPVGNAFSPADINWDIAIEGGADGAFDNICLWNGTRGLRIRQRELGLTAGRFYLTQVFGSSFQTFLEVDGAFDSVYIDEIHPWPYAGAGGPELKWRRENGSALRLGRADNLKIGRFHAFGYKYGIDIFESAGRLPGADERDGSVNHIHIDSFTADDSAVALRSTATTLTTIDIDHLHVSGYWPGDPLLVDTSPRMIQNTSGPMVATIKHLEGNIGRGDWIEVSNAGGGSSVTIHNLEIYDGTVTTNNIIGTKPVFNVTAGNEVVVGRAMVEPNCAAAGWQSGGGVVRALNNAEASPLRSQISQMTIVGDSFTLAGETTVGDAGSGAPYKRGTAGGLRAIQDKSGQWYNLQLPNNVAPLGWFGDLVTSNATRNAAVAAALASPASTILWPAFFVELSQAFTLPDRSIVFSGMGESVSGPVAANGFTGDLFSRDYTLNQRSFSAQFMSFRTRANAQGRAIRLSWPDADGFNHRAKQRFSLTEVEFVGDVQYTEGWAQAIKLTNVVYASIANCNFTGRGGNPLAFDQATLETSLLAIEIDGGYSPVDLQMDNTVIQYWRRAYLIGGAFEGLYITGSTIICCGDGVDWATGFFAPNYPVTPGGNAAGRPLLQISDSHLSTYRSAVKTNGVVDIRLSNNTIYQNDRATASEYLIDIINAELVSIESNSFWAYLTTPRSRGVILRANVTKWNITNNYFASRAANAFEQGITILAGATKGSIASDNIFDGTFLNGAIVNNEPTTALGGVRAATVRRTTNLTLTSGAGAAVTWPSAVIDTGGIFNPGQPSRLTVPQGSYMCSVGAKVTYAAGAAGVRSLEILHNGARTKIGLPALVINAAATGETYMTVWSDPIPVQPGDYFELVVFHTQGANLDVLPLEKTWFTLRCF